MNVDFLFPIWQILPSLLVSLGAEHTQKNKIKQEQKKKTRSDGWITLWRTERNDDDDAETIIIITLAHNERVIIITHTVCFIMRYVEEERGVLESWGEKELATQNVYRNTAECVRSSHLPDRTGM